MAGMSGHFFVCACAWVSGDRARQAVMRPLYHVQVHKTGENPHTGGVEHLAAGWWSYFGGEKGHLAAFQQQVAAGFARRVNGEAVLYEQLSH